MKESEIAEWKSKINAMTQEDMACLWRFAPAGHPVFDRNLPLYEYFKERFDGFNPDLSKKIGWKE
jgi:hypothetical protein